MGFLSDLFGPTQRTSTFSKQQQQTGSTSGTTTSTPTLSPELQAIMQQLMAYGSQSMANPAATLAPIRQAGLQGINQAYASVPGQVSRQMASRGYGASGPAGNAMYRANLARAGSVSNLEGQLAGQGIQQSQFGADLSSRLLQAMKGTTTSTSGTSSSSGTSSGTDTQPGPSVFTSILGGASQVFGLMNALKGPTEQQDTFAPISPYTGPSTFGAPTAPNVTYTPPPIPSLPSWLTNNAPPPPYGD